jgi:signal transduction histidine kinase
MVRALDGDTDLHDVLELIAKRGRALVDAEWLVILLADPPELEVSAVAGEMDRGLVGSRLPLDGSTSSHVIRDRRPRRIADVSGKFEDAGAALFVPLVFRGRALGVFVVSDGADGGQLTDDDERLLVSFAAGAANAVHTAKSVEAKRLRLSIEAAERERRRWALELHDETLQGLGGLRVLLSSALRGAPEKLADAVRGAIDQLTVEIAGLRRLITELRPAALDELGLVPAIETLAERTAAMHELTVETNIELGIEMGARFDPEIESTLYRLAQEALTNVVKHADASRVEIALVRRGASIGLTVTDDGAGFDPDHPDRGFGLIGMQERVALAGGRLDVRSKPGRGTTLTADLPAGSTEPVPAPARSS